jgi:hypothetical protein
MTVTPNNTTPIFSEQDAMSQAQEDLPIDGTIVEGSLVDVELNADTSSATAWLFDVQPSSSIEPVHHGPEPVGSDASGLSATAPAPNFAAIIINANSGRLFDAVTAYDPGFSGS